MEWETCAADNAFRQCSPNVTDSENCQTVLSGFPIVFSDWSVCLSTVMQLATLKYTVFPLV